MLKDVQRLGTVTITLRGKPVAKLVSLAEAKADDAGNDPAIGMWADREDMKDVHAWLTKIRAPRYTR